MGGLKHAPTFFATFAFFAVKFPVLFVNFESFLVKFFAAVLNGR
jgi:hypothetical protein